MHSEITDERVNSVHISFIFFKGYHAQKVVIQGTSCP